MWRRGIQCHRSERVLNQGFPFTLIMSTFVFSSQHMLKDLGLRRSYSAVTVSPSGPRKLFKGVTTATSGVLARFPWLLPVRNSFAVRVTGPLPSLVSCASLGAALDAGRTTSNVIQDIPHPPRRPRLQRPRLQRTSRCGFGRRMAVKVGRNHVCLQLLLRLYATHLTVTL